MVKAGDLGYDEPRAAHCSLRRVCRVVGQVPPVVDVGPAGVQLVRNRVRIDGRGYPRIGYLLGVETQVAEVVLKIPRMLSGDLLNLPQHRHTHLVVRLRHHLCRTIRVATLMLMEVSKKKAYGPHQRGQCHMDN